ncbi:unnamed protein product, partial [Onchocerca ochengi]
KHRDEYRQAGNNAQSIERLDESNARTACRLSKIGRLVIQRSGQIILYTLLLPAGRRIA